MLSTGDFELAVTSRGKTVLDLEWLNFAPADYRFEYVVLYRENTYHPDINQWNIREIGNAPKCSLEGLKPAKLHFIRVAIWEDARAGIIGNMTETISVETRRTEFCIHMGEYFNVGQHVINDCEEKCTCLPTGEFECYPLCEMQGVPEVEEGCHIIPGENCCDFKVSCTVGGVSCLVDDVTYPHGSEFEHNCQQCTCSHGQVECHFPEECQEMEATPECPYPNKVEVEGQCCPEWHCADLDDDACHYEMQRYEEGQYFSSENCGLCQCHGAAGVRCPPKCPPVLMMQPSLECPDPEIRKEGCCDTIHCNYANLSLPQLIGRMFARSYSPVTLTVSFEASPLSEETEVPLYREYEILFANTSDTQLSWNRRLVQPVDVRIRQDRPQRDQPSSSPSPSSSSYSDPLDPLTRDSAIVVGERVYITLSGVDPNTTYFVKVNPLLAGTPYHESLMDGELPAHAAGAASSTTVVVKTMPLDNVSSCFYEGKQLLHGQLAKETCRESCRCDLGKVSCVSTCPTEQVVVARSRSCPQPRLEQVQDSCCRQWKCYPSATDCLYSDIILSSGQSMRRACDLCTCRNGTVSCSSQCEDVQVPPRPSCVLTNITGHCCPQWTCPIENHPPYGVKTSIDIYLDGKCPNDTFNFIHDLKKDLVHQMTIVCNENRSPGLTNYCNNLQINVQCDSHTKLMSSRSHRKRQASSVISNNSLTAADSETGGRINAQILLFANFSQESPAELTEELLQSAALQLMARLNRSVHVQLPSGQVVSVVKISSLPQISYVCDSGFAFERGQCVLSQVETSLVSRTSTGMEATDVTDTLAVLTWHRLSDKTLAQISNLMVVHRRHGELDWIPSIPLEPHRSTYLLRALEAGQVYDARLVASMTWPEHSRWVMAEVEVETLRQSEFQTGPTLSIIKVPVSSDYASVYWDKIPEELASTVLAIEIRWRESKDKIYTFSQKLHDVHQCVAHIPALTEDTAYTAEVRLLLKSGSTANSGLIHFVTKSRERTFEDVIVVACVSCALSFLVVAALAVGIVMWRRRKAQGSAVGFINHTFGVQPDKKREINAVANSGAI
ncbi:connective tissue growth factor [Elysia marginata]|uniref:Connective tissue growth factor n=1 Tax=Elysia marginata TaxID=1093978 RepID=A0AAV4JLH1_9GAST|nr:connective tissue growth factor [Elysia marginata]